jgi:cytoskeleton-associated protein 5
MMDDLNPRSSIAHIANSKLFGKLDDKNWKIRKEGLDAIDEALASAAGRVLPEGIDDLMKAIGLRIADPNKSIARGFIGLAGRMAEALGSECR